ncbi:Clavaminate synthase-like protein [Venustampulla echinocandica]|uniref:Clavaminate synthase-like protein n=1 Tax=Venustampulla echinocandica TaxID=2656787 RepID=A0A370T904_9HELO|nr:Clavaminate synthase-like protein [Venustampulla echinocandica]RDL29969.1 Clavaminate synthase-like protein [Venustampulla echinocandica]
MESISRTRLSTNIPRLTRALLHHRHVTTSTQSQFKSKKEGDISSVFVSLSSGAVEPLPERFADVKRQLVGGREGKISASWRRLLKALEQEVETISTRGPAIIPTIKYEELDANLPDFQADLKKRGAAVIRNVVPQSEARAYKEEIERYVKANPSTKAFPQDDPQVFELYWSAPQVRARAHPNLLRTQRLLMNAWHSKDPDALISTSSPVSYADRLRIRQPGDAGFALGPHIDGGSVERWEKSGYGLSDLYDKVWEGDWENYDPWESSSRLPVVSDLYEGAGACSMLRMFQGWLSMSRTRPGEGTLQVNPMVKLTTAYTLLRPFFRSIRPFEVDGSGKPTREYLDAANWELEPQYTATLQGANPGHSQELNEELHPHLQLSKSMIHVPDIEPGDYVVWHCDTIHAVDKVHNGKSDSSVLYIPTCPLTESNARYLSRQRDAFMQGSPGPDFPGGRGESEHVGRPDATYIKKVSDNTGLQAMGFKSWQGDEKLQGKGERKMLSRANDILGFDASV